MNGKKKRITFRQPPATKQNIWSKKILWVGRKKGIIYSISITDIIYVMLAKDRLRLNSLWVREPFKTLEEAQDWCNAYEIKELTQENIDKILGKFK